jgi:hypothetical protein
MPANTGIRLSNGFGEKGGKPDEVLRGHQEMPLLRIYARLFSALIA